MRMRTGLLLGAVLALGAAGCGGDDAGDTGIASAGGTATPSSSASAASGNDSDGFLRYAQCVRDNGVPEFPDPEVDGGKVHLQLPPGLDREKVEAAQAKCRQYLPNGGEGNRQIDPEAREQILKFAQCMRENGVPNFPDPAEDGGIRLNVDELGIDPQSETFKSAEEKCKQYQPSPPPDGGRTRTGGTAGGTGGSAGGTGGSAGGTGGAAGGSAGSAGGSAG